MASKMKHTKGNVLILKLFGNCFIRQNRRLKLNYKAMES